MDASVQLHDLAALTLGKTPSHPSSGRVPEPGGLGEDKNLLPLSGFESLMSSSCTDNTNWNKNQFSCRCVHFEALKTN